MHDPLIIYAIPGHGCNANCKYCFQLRESDAASKVMSQEVLDKFVEYLRFIRFKFPDNKIMLNFFGAEPTLYFDKIEQIINKGKRFATCFSIVTNGLNILKNKEKLIELRDLAFSAKSGLSASVSYDFIFQDQNRIANSNEKVREAILWLADNGMLHKIITVLTPESLSRLDEVFEDFLKLREHNATIRCGWQLDSSNDWSSFDAEKTRAALEKIKAYQDAHPETKKAFFFNASFYNTPLECKEYCAMGNKFAAIDFDGSVYMDRQIMFFPDSTSNVLKYGSIFDDFDELLENQKKTIASLKLTKPEKCNNCVAPCKVGTNIGYLPDYRQGVTNDKICEARKLLYEILKPNTIVD